MDKDKIKFLIDSVSILLGELADEIKKDDLPSEKKKKEKKNKKQKLDKGRLWDYNEEQEQVDYFEQGH